VTKEYHSAGFQWRKTKHEQLGRLLDALDASPYAANTVIVLYTDHGFHPGEKQRWAKWSLWERSTHVPFIVSVPGGRQSVIAGLKKHLPR
jgi:arylsulfatase A-like enzyme